MKGNWSGRSGFYPMACRCCQSPTDDSPGTCYGNPVRWRSVL